MKREISTFKKLSYGAGEFFNASTVVIILMLYLKFLTDVVGLSPMLAGICLVAGKAWDAISDPLIGTISDRTRSRFGRRRIFFLLFAIPASLSFVAMWLAIGFESDWAKVVYYAVAYVTFKTLSSLLMVPYQALGPELAKGYDERTSIITFRMAFSPVSAILASVIPNIIVRRFSEAGEAALGHLVVAGAFGAVYVVIWFWIFAVIRERGQHLEAATRTPIFKALKLTLRNRSGRIVLAIYLLAFLGVDVLTASTKYFFDEYVRRPELMSPVMGVMLGTTMLSLPVHSFLVRRFERRKAYLIGGAILVVGLLTLFIVPRSSPSAVLLGCMFVIGFGFGAPFLAPWAMVPEVIDVELACTGRSEEGIYTGIMTFLRKATTSIALFGIATALEVFGYVAPEQLQGAPQSDEARMSIRVFTTLVPLLLIIASMVAASRYPISRRVHALIRKAIDKREEGGMGDETLDAGEAEALKDALKRAYGESPSSKPSR